MICLVYIRINLLHHLYLIISKILNLLLFVIPIICYRYNKAIRNIIFNYNKLASDLLTLILILLIHESVKIPNLFTRQQVMLSLEI